MAMMRSSLLLALCALFSSTLAFAPPPQSKSSKAPLTVSKFFRWDSSDYLMDDGYYSNHDRSYCDNSPYRGGYYDNYYGGYDRPSYYYGSNYRNNLYGNRQNGYAMYGNNYAGYGRYQGYDDFGYGEDNMWHHTMHNDMNYGPYSSYYGPYRYHYGRQQPNYDYYNGFNNLETNGDSPFGGAYILEGSRPDTGHGGEMGRYGYGNGGYGGFGRNGGFYRDDYASAAGVMSDPTMTVNNRHWYE